MQASLCASLRLALVISSLAFVVSAQDTKRQADQIIDVLRGHFDAETELFGTAEDTALALSALSRSPRRYTELDGPFIRRPARRIADDTSLSAAQRALALAGMVTPTLVAARDRAIGELSILAPADYGVDEWRAIRTYEALDYDFAANIWAQARPATLEGRVLVAERPEGLAAPVAADDPAAWTRWARAARLRGLAPDAATLPALPPVIPEAPVADLVASLETVIASHGLDRPKAGGGPEPEPLPGFVAQGGSLDDARRAAFAFLESHQIEGTFGLELGPPSAHEPELGITALNLSAALSLVDDLGLERPEWIDQGLDFVASHAHPDGSIYRFGLTVYTTSVAMEALQAGGRAEHLALVVAGRNYLIMAQSDEGEGYSSIDDPHYGGIGYGGDERPDMSNHQMGVEAISRAGTPKDDPVFEKALAFAKRNQNYGERAPQEWPRRKGGRLIAGNDGGGTYMPGNSPAGELDLGDGTYVARSYGSMTYALTKVFLLCGLAPDNGRVKAAVTWLADNFDVERNPGFADPLQGGDGLYYYYLAMSRTLSLIDDARFVTSAGERVAWRDQLARHLLDHQRTDGSWINELSPRWWEGAPTLATAYAVLALDSAEVSP